MDGCIFIRILVVIHFASRYCAGLNEVTNPCGMLKIPQPALRNTNVAIVFQLGEGKSEDAVVVEWLFMKDGVKRSYRVISASSTEYFFSRLNDTFKIEIKAADDGDLGKYHVNVNDKRGTYICSSGDVELQLQDPQAKVRLTSPTSYFPGCDKCLYADIGHELDVECSFNNVEDEESVIIHLDSLDGTRALTKATRQSRGRYIATIRQIIDDNHMANVTCQVSASSLPQTLNVTSKLYVLRMPNQPILRVGLLNEGQQANISCKSDNSRPPPSLYFQVGEMKITVTQTDKTYIESGIRSPRYHSTATINNLKFWKDESIKCCLRHESLKEPLCSDGLKIQHEYQQSRLEEGTSMWNISSCRFIIIGVGILATIMSVVSVALLVYIKRRPNNSNNNDNCILSAIQEPSNGVNEDYEKLDEELREPQDDPNYCELRELHTDEFAFDHH